jgi:nucleoid-associated protein YgaU
MVARPAAAIFTVTPIDPPGPAHRFLMGEQPPRLTRQVKYNNLPRPWNTDATEFQGHTPFTLVLSAALSYLDVDRSIEDLLLKAELAFSQPTPPKKQPATLKVAGPGIPPLARLGHWKFVKWTPSDEERIESGDRTLAYFELEFIQYVPATYLMAQGGSPAQRSASRVVAAVPTIGQTGSTIGRAPRPGEPGFIGPVQRTDTPSQNRPIIAGPPAPGGVPGAQGPPAPNTPGGVAMPLPPYYVALPNTPSQPQPSNRTYTVRAGDTLGGIAVRELGSFNRWHDIADLNGIRDPNSLRIGQVLRLPVGGGPQVQVGRPM